MKPTINLSGNDPEDMLVTLQNVVLSCNDLISRMHRCNPHPRNYPGDDTGYLRDQEIWVQHKRRVLDIIQDAEWTMEHIIEQVRGEWIVTNAD